MENLIKELKIGIGMEHMPCGKFEANAMYFGIGVITYNLMVAQKYFVIKEGYENKTIQTLRWKLIQVPARLIKTSRYIILKIETVVETLYRHPAWKRSWIRISAEYRRTSKDKHEERSLIFQHGLQPTPRNRKRS